MESLIREALLALASDHHCTIEGLGELRLNVGEDRKVEFPNPITGENSVTVIPGKRRLRFEHGPALEALIEGTTLDTAGLPPLVQRAIAELQASGAALIPGLGHLRLVERPAIAGPIRNPFTGERMETTLEARRILRFGHGSALRAVVRGKPVPAVLASAELAGIIEAYPVMDWPLAELLARLERKRRRGESDVALIDGAPRLFRDFRAQVVATPSPAGSLEIAEGGGELYGYEVAPGAAWDLTAFSEVLRRGNGDRWMATPTKAGAVAFWIDHEAKNALDDGAPLDRLLAAWLFHHEVLVTAGERVLTGEDFTALSDHLAKLCPEAVQSGSFAPFPV